MTSFILGGATTRFASHVNRSFEGLACEAARAALRDSNIGPDVIDAVVVSNAAGASAVGREMIRGQAWLRGIGLSTAPVFNVDNACAGGSSAFLLAMAMIDSGWIDTALVLGVEKLTHLSRDEATRIIGSGTVGQPSGLEEGHGNLALLHYAREMEALIASGVVGEREFARIAVKNRRHASKNPAAQFREVIDERRVDESPVVVGSLRRLHCSPISDGAAGLVLSSSRPSANAVRVVSAASMSGLDGKESVVRATADEAYRRAAIDPADVDVFEVHDATAVGELVRYEALRICEMEDVPDHLARGSFSLEGRMPVNPSGGLMSKGHPIGATGLAQVVEILLHLQGRAEGRQVSDAKIGLAENAGGLIGDSEAICNVIILARNGR